MKRLFSAIILFGMILSFCACGQVDEEIVPDYITSIEEIDFMGVDFLFAQNNSHNSTGDGYMGYLIDTEFADLAKERIEEVEKKYNVKIKITTDTNVSQTIQNETYSGQVKMDAIQTASQGMSGAIRAGFMYDLADLSDYIDYRQAEKWGKVEDLKPFCWDGGIFGVIPAAWPMLKYNSMDGPLIVNEDIISYLNETDPREFVETNEWTWDKFEELMPIYSHINDQGDEVTALYSSDHWLCRTMQTSNGEGVIVQDSEGEYQLGLHSEKTFEAMNTAWNWAFGEYSTFVDIDDGHNWPDMLQAFIDKRTVFTIVSATELIGTASSISYNMSNYGVIPFPRGPHGNNKTTSGTTITGTLFGMGIPQLCKDPAMSAIVLNAIYEPLPGYETKQSIIDYLSQNFFFDDRDVTNFIDAYDNLYYNYRYEGLTDVYINLNKSKTMREWLDQYAEADEANRVKYAVNIETTVSELFGE
ncbi:MAG: extracellular solute-binding protein [Ruminococcaceae bacterium]|nr:extracellular solute-binding protein [Oscillospiraceae bacterium]